MKYFSVSWLVSSQGSRDHWISRVVQTQTRDEAVEKSLEGIGCERCVVDFTRKDLIRRELHSRNNVQYKAPCLDSTEHAFELELKKAKNKETGAVEMVLLPVDRDAHPEQNLYTGHTLYSTLVKWTSYTDSGDINAVHMIEDTQSAANMDIAAIKTMTRIIRTAEFNLRMSNEDAFEKMNKSECVYQNGMNKYEIIQVSKLKLLTIELDGWRRECAIPAIKDNNTPVAAILIA